MSDGEKWLKRAFWLALAGGVFAGAMRSMDDADIWFQLLAGRYALDVGVVPKTDFFLYVGTQAAQQFGGWGFGVLYELAIRAFGWPGASLLNSLIWTLAFGFAIRAAMLRAGKDWLDLAKSGLR